MSWTRSTIQTAAPPPEAPEAPEPRNARQLPPSGPGRGGADSATLRATEATRANLWALWRKSWQPLETSATSRIRSHFYDLRSEVLANLDRLAGQIAPDDDAEAKARVKFHPDRKRDLIAELLFDLAAAGEALVVKPRPLLRMAHQLGGEQTMREAADSQGVETPDPFNLRDPNLSRLLGQREIRLKDVDANLRSRLARRLAEAVDAGQTQQQIAEAVRTEFGFARKRAKLIAQTEIGGAVEESRNLARVQAGVPLKSWLSSRKGENARAQHAATERATFAEPIPVGERFTIAGTSITCQYPRESGLPPEQAIGCSCSTLSRYPGDTIKAVLDRYTARGFLTYAQLIERTTPQPNAKDGKP